MADGIKGGALHAWPLAFSVAFPLILLLAPIGQRLAARLTATDS